ncbi:uncharacterized protein K441DRAFT_682026 [Cenococcum geophilum 1.58]|uniref:Uncharacterized protein n=1 Tax=Cenococcum geophilum 1.58 TaxID=794803 RepID=A0ACC8EPZ6_9PEZI|nr:hypothetical protein K441DRAFT_682026 [Cenococcum geophilum 1.58]
MSILLQNFIPPSSVQAAPSAMQIQQNAQEDRRSGFAVNEDPTWYEKFAQKGAESGELASTGGCEGRYEELPNVASLAGRRKCDLRIICAPHDVPRPCDVYELHSLFRLFDIPPSFLCERLQSVTHSFGTRRRRNGPHYAWLHFICKIIEIEEVEVMLHRPRQGGIRWQLTDNFRDWYRPGFILVDGSKNPGALSLSRSGSTRTTVNQPGGVTLICFMAPEGLMRRFSTLLDHPEWEDVLEDPFILYDIILEELYLILDAMVRTLGKVFNGVEHDTNEKTADLNGATGDIDFGMLHKVARNVIYMREATDCAVNMVESLRAHHDYGYTERDPMPPVARGTQISLHYKKDLMVSTQAKVNSLEKRMQNIIGLSFNLVTQQDSCVMKTDSSSMKTIAIMTLVFLPASTVATIFGMQFFTLSSDEEFPAPHFRAHSSIRIFWAIAVPLTVAVLIVWLAWYRYAQRKISGTNRKMKRDHMV